ncbi:pancreatic progenitor cell differentiation and proliferation factor-like protein isoform X1 [Anser cygnoides]|uniref:pancreatic progenitor cell differentiation and proliferation factor-like protein isoform X1 n=1 Tax=Anser cygnoides TaxID=8845 RepID=UPI002009259B|nr:pancreatic progenitor cell differentiation and proliferation factor-like protein isoform X1 [Anser cygnoides]
MWQEPSYNVTQKRHSPRLHLGTIWSLEGPSRCRALHRARQNSESSVSSSSSCSSDPVSVTDQEKAFHGLPELLDKCWWIKSFFHCEPSPPTVGRKTLSASSANS